MCSLRRKDMLIEKIEIDLKNALKSRDKIKVSTLRLLKSAIGYLAIERKEDLKDDDVISVIKKQVKQRKDSIEGFKKGNREDLAQKEEVELKILKAYLPEEITPEALSAIIDEAINETGANTPKDMGMVMKAVMAKTKHSADGKVVSSIVNEKLSKSD